VIGLYMCVQSDLTPAASSFVDTVSQLGDTDGGAGGNRVVVGDCSDPSRSYFIGCAITAWGRW
jgi:hypothetical protein